jgi:hypothetical protein
VVVGLVVLGVALVAPLFAPKQSAGPGATLSSRPTGGSSPYATAAGSRPVSINGGDDFACQSEGGCAAFFQIQAVDESPQPMIASGFTTAGGASGWSDFRWTSAGTPLRGIGQVLPGWPGLVQF